jgi:hypothetical protein
VPADGKCAVSADEHWTPQEQFVWSRVCVGEVADFNKEPRYGGDLDPKSPDGLPESRILSSTFLETILLQEKYRDALTRRGVRIVGARFTEVVDLENAELGHELWLDKSLLEKGANFFDLTTMHRITINGSMVTGPLNMKRLHIGRDLDLHGSKITGKLDMEGIEAEHLVMSYKAEFAEVDPGNAHVRGVLSLYDSTVTGTLRLYGLQVDRILGANECTFKKGVDLSLARIGEELDLNLSKVTGTLSMEGIRAEHLLMRAKFADVDLKYAHVRGVLSLYGSTVTGTLEMRGLQVDGTLQASRCKCHEGVDLSLAHIGGKP